MNYYSTNPMSEIKAIDIYCSVNWGFPSLYKGLVVFLVVITECLTSGGVFYTLRSLLKLTFEALRLAFWLLFLDPIVILSFNDYFATFPGFTCLELRSRLEYLWLAICESLELLLLAIVRSIFLFFGYLVSE